MHFDTTNYLKINRYHTTKHPCSIALLTMDEQCILQIIFNIVRSLKSYDLTIILINLIGSYSMLDCITNTILNYAQPIKIILHDQPTTFILVSIIIRSKINLYEFFLFIKIIFFLKKILGINLVRFRLCLTKSTGFA